MAENKYNVIWILVDQMRAQAMGHRGDENVSTPNLDRIATEGTNFVQAISGTPLCTPFRGSLLTGKYPHNSSVPALNSPLSTSIPTVANVFQDNNYRTCWIGKWHLDGDRPEIDLSRPENKKNVRFIPKERRSGFDDWWGYENNNQPYNCIIHKDYEGETDSYRLPGYETDDLTNILIDWLKDRKEDQNEKKAFFATLSVQPPHDPYVAPEESSAKYPPSSIHLRPNVPNEEKVVSRAKNDLSGYYGAIDRIDWNVGRIRKVLRELNMDQDTYVMFFSDHGDMHGSQGQYRKMAPWEESIRIPFMVFGPTRSSFKKKEVDYPINHVDISPTTLGLCGIAVPKEMEGFDYSIYIKEESEPDNTGEPPPKSAYISLPVPTAYQSGLIPEEGIDRPFRGVVTRDKWKYIVLEHQPWLMYNLNEDPYELINLAHNVFYKEKRLELHNDLNSWIKKTGDSFFMPSL